VASRADGRAAVRRQPLVCAAALAVAVLAGGCTAPSWPPDPPGPSTTEDGCEDLCLELEPVVLGAILPLSGPLAPFGQAQERGIRAALDEANEAGGVDVGGEQREVRLEVADDHGSADAAGQFAWSFVLGRAEVTALLGVCSPPRTVLTVAEARDVPLLAACGPLPSTGSPAPAAWLWERGPSEPARARAVGQALAASGGTRLAVFLSPGHDAAPWTTAAEAHGLAVAGTWTAPETARRERGSTDWSGPLGQARAAGADLVVAVTDFPDGAALWRQLAGSGLAPRRAYASEAGLSSVWRAAVGDAAEGTLTDLHGDLAQGPDAALEQAARQATQTLLDALSAAGSDRREAVNAALPTVGARLTGTQGGQPARLGQWRGDRLVPLGP
jgi:branched-chain amino acid transport system substrate-binding protein